MPFFGSGRCRERLPIGAGKHLEQVCGADRNPVHPGQSQALAADDPGEQVHAEANKIRERLASGLITRQVTRSLARGPERPFAVAHRTTRAGERLGTVDRPNHFDAGEIRRARS